MHEPELLQHRPGLFESHGFHAVQNLVRHFWATIGEAFPVPLRRVLRHVLRGKKSLLSMSVGHGRCGKEQAKNRTKHLLDYFSRHVRPLHFLFYALFGSNQPVPGICAFLATASSISTPKPGLSVTVTYPF